jgi:pyruvate kinase
MKKNLPSRAEITDAAFGQRADCIMLNKGAFATDTIKILKDILRDMHKIFKKNKQLLNVCEEWKKQ